MQQSRIVGEINTYDVMKVIAVLLMVIDHIGLFFFPEIPLFRVFGRLSFPIFFFLIGVSGSSRVTPMLLLCIILIALVEFIYMFNGQNISYIQLVSFSILPAVIISKLSNKYYRTQTILELVLQWPLLILVSLLFRPIIPYGLMGAVLGMAGYLYANYPGKISRLILFITLVIHLIIESYVLSFSINYIILLNGLFLMLYLVFVNFKIAPITFLNIKANSLLRVISRNSLFIYVTHLELFKLVGILLQY